MSSRKPSSLNVPTVIYVTNDTTSPGYLTTADAARYLGVDPTVLRRWRYRKVGPPYRKFSGSKGTVLYAEAELVAYVAARYVRTDRMPRPYHARNPRQP